MSDETTTPEEPDAIDESPYEIDEDAHSIATMVGSLGNPGSVENEDEDDGTENTVATEVGVLGWPEGAENEEGTRADGSTADAPEAPSWTVSDATES